MLYEEVEYLIKHGWRLESHGSFLWFRWGFQWVRDTGGKITEPFSSAEALAIQRYLDLYV